MLPQNLDYNSPKLTSLPCRSVRNNLIPVNGTGKYYKGDVIKTYIRTPNNGVQVSSESYLKFYLNLKNGSTASNIIRMDSCGAHGCFQSLYTKHGSSTIENHENYPAMVKEFKDLMLSGDAKNKYSMLDGTSQQLSLQLPTIAAVADISTKNFAVDPINVGRKIFITAAGGTQRICFCLNLFSILCGLNTEKYLPLAFMTGAPLELNLVVNDFLSYLSCSSDLDETGCYIDGVNFIQSTLELSDSAMGILLSQNQKLSYNITQYKMYTTPVNLTSVLVSGTVANNNAVYLQQEYNVMLPLRYSSLKAIILSFKNNAKVRSGMANQGIYPLSSVNCAKISQYQFKIGSMVIPSSAVQNYEEMFVELIKSVDALSNINYTPLINISTYTMETYGQNLDETASSTSMSKAQSGTFYIGCSCETYENAINKDRIYAGLNTINNDVVFNFLASPPETMAMKIEALAIFDAVLEFENGLCFTRY